MHLKLMGSLLESLRIRASGEQAYMHVSIAGCEVVCVAQDGGTANGPLDPGVSFVSEEVINHIAMYPSNPNNPQDKTTVHVCTLNASTLKTLLHVHYKHVNVHARVYHVSMGISGGVVTKGNSRNGIAASSSTAAMENIHLRM